MSEGPDAEAAPGFLARLGGLYFNPGDQLHDITRRPAFWAPLVAFVALGAAFNAVWLHAIDPAEFARVQIEDSPLAEQLSPAQRAEGIAQQARVFPLRSWLWPLVFSPLSLVLLAAVYLAVFRFFYGGEVSLRQSLSIVVWTYLAVFLVSMPLTLLVLYLKEDWNVDPSTALQANLSLLLDKATVPRAVYSLAESLDLFSAWTVALLSMGFAAACGIRTARAAIGVVAVWAVYVAGKAGLAAFF
jgi:Yip1-like protein